MTAELKVNTGVQIKYNRLITAIAISFSALPYLIIAEAFAIAGSVLLYYSFRIGEVSSTVPMLNLTPIFMLPFSFIFLGEVPGVVNLLGILLVCTGGFLIGRFSRVRKASIIAVLVAVLWACAGVFHKKALLSMNMLSFVFLSFFIKSAVLSLPSAIEVKRYGVELRDLKYLLISAVTTLIALSCNYYAYILTQAVYVITVKRLSALFSVILAGKMLSELAIKEKLAKVVLMVLVVTFFKYAIHVSYKTSLELLYLAAGTLMLALALYYSHKH